MAARQRILIVDDDRRMCGFVTKFLEREGFAAEFALNGAGMREAIAAGIFNLIILDLTFPNGDDGITLARSLRACSETPLIMLSGKCEIIDKIVCLEIGADDYLTKPFEPRELLARIRTILRRSQTHGATRGRRCRRRTNWPTFTDSAAISTVRRWLDRMVCTSLLPAKSSAC